MANSRSSLRKIIGASQEALFPGFGLFDGESSYLWPNEIAYHKKVQGFDLFLVLSPHEQDSSQFTVDVGWSRKGRFPELMMRPSFIDPDEDHSEFSQDEYFTRIGILENGIDKWWKITSPEDAADTLKNVAAEVERVAIPYLDLLAKSSNAETQGSP